MSQHIYWNWEDDDLTANLNYRFAGILKPGRYLGYDNDPFQADRNLVLNMDQGFLLTKTDKSQVRRSVVYTPQGVVVQEDSDITLQIDAGDSEDRIDLIILEHEYVFAQNGSTGIYKVIKGTPAPSPSEPSVPNPEIQTVIGALYVPANMNTLNEAGVVWTKRPTPEFAGDSNIAYLDRAQTFNGANTFAMLITLAGGFLAGTSTVDGNLTVTGNKTTQGNNTTEGDKVVKGNQTVEGNTDLQKDVKVGRTVSFHLDENPLSPDSSNAVALEHGNIFYVADGPFGATVESFKTARSKGTVLWLRHTDEINYDSSPGKILLPAGFPTVYTAKQGELLAFVCTDEANKIYRLLSASFYENNVYSSNHYLIDGENFNISLGRLDLGLHNIGRNWQDQSLVPNPFGGIQFDGSDVKTYRYIVIGKTIFVEFRAETLGVSSVSTLTILIPGGRVAANTGGSVGHFDSDGAFPEEGSCVVEWIAGDDKIYIKKHDGSNFNGAVDNFLLHFSVSFEIQ